MQFYSLSELNVKYLYSKTGKKFLPVLEKLILKLSYLEYIGLFGSLVKYRINELSDLDCLLVFSDQIRVDRQIVSRLLGDVFDGHVPSWLDWHCISESKLNQLDFAPPPAFPNCILKEAIWLRTKQL